MKTYNKFRSEVRPRIFAILMIAVIIVITYLVYRNGIAIDEINILQFILPVLYMCLINSLWHYTFVRLFTGYKNKYDALEASRSDEWTYLYIHLRPHDSVTEWIFCDPIGQLAGSVDVGAASLPHSLQSKMILQLFGHDLVTEIHARPNKRRPYVQSKVDPKWFFKIVEKKNGQLKIVPFKKSVITKITA